MRLVDRTLACLPEEDLDFLVKSVVTRRTDHDRVKEIIRDKADLIDIMLDDPNLFARLMENQEVLLQVSPYLLFSIWLRQVQRELQDCSFTLELLETAERVAVFDAPRVSSLLDNQALRNYLVEVLASFTRTGSLVMFIQVGPRLERHRLSDMDVAGLLLLSETANPQHQFSLYKRLGDLSLFLTGVFPEAVVKRPEDYLAPQRQGRRHNLEDFLEIGPHFYQRASACPEAARTGLEEVLTTLSRDFALARKPLNLLAQKLIGFERYRFCGLDPA